MPIMGLTDRASVVPRWPRIGYLRKGGSKQGGQRWGKDLDYFRFTSDDPLVIAAFRKAYGEKPDRMEVYLPYATAEENFETSMDEWAASGLVHRCDGVTCILYRTDNGTISHDPIPCPYASGKKTRTEDRPGCVKTGKLHVVLPGLIEHGFVGQVTLLTGSDHDLRYIIKVLFKVEEMRPEGMQGVPFTLRRYRAKVSVPLDNGTRRRIKKSLVALVPAPTWYDAHLALARSEAFALPDGITPSVIDAEVSELERVDPEIEVDPKTGEITSEDAQPKSETRAKQEQGSRPTTRNGKSWSDVIKTLVDTELANSPKAAIHALNLSKAVGPTDADDIIIEWMLAFKNASDADAKEENAAARADEAIETVLKKVDAETAEETFVKEIQAKQEELI